MDKEQQQERLVSATNIWNAIDDLSEPEPWWDAMTGCMSWAFRDCENANSILFTYEDEQ